MKGGSSFLLGAVGLAVLSSAGATGDEGEAILGSPGHPMIQARAEAQIDASGEASGFSERGSREKVEEQSQQSQQTGEKSMKRPRFGEGYYEGDIQVLDDGWSSDLRYGLGYESRISGGRPGGGSGSHTGGPGAGRAGSSGQGGGGH